MVMLEFVKNLILFYCISDITAVVTNVFTNTYYMRARAGLCSTYIIIPVTSASKIYCAKFCHNRGEICVGFCYNRSTMGCNLYTIANIQGNTIIRNKYYGYSFFPTAVNHSTASESCTSYGSYLSMPQDMQENHNVKSLPTLFGYANKDMWIGCNSTVQGLLFLSDVDGQKINFTNWAYGQPDNNRGIERCGEIYVTGKWNDLNCALVLPFSCQSPAFGCPNAPIGTSGENEQEICYMRM